MKRILTSIQKKSNTVGSENNNNNNNVASSESHVGDNTSTKSDQSNAAMGTTPRRESVVSRHSSTTHESAKKDEGVGIGLGRNPDEDDEYNDQLDSGSNMAMPSDVSLVDVLIADEAVQQNLAEDKPNDDIVKVMALLKTIKETIGDAEHEQDTQHVFKKIRSIRDTFSEAFKQPEVTTLYNATLKKLTAFTHAKEKATRAKKSSPQHGGNSNNNSNHPSLQGSSSADLINYYRIDMNSDSPLFSAALEKHIKLYMSYPINGDEYVRKWGPDPDALKQTESYFLSAQNNIIDFFFNQFKTIDTTTGSYLSYYRTMNEMVRDHEWIFLNKKDEISRIYTAYFHLCSDLDEMHDEIEKFKDLNTKKMNQDDRKSIEAESLSLKTRMKELNDEYIVPIKHQIDQTIDRSKDTHNKNILLHEQWRKERDKLELIDAIYTKLLEDTTISFDEYTFLEKNQQTNHSNNPNKNANLLRIAKSMITIEPGLDAINEQIEKNMAAFIEESLNLFIKSIRIHINELLTTFDSSLFNEQRIWDMLKFYIFTIVDLIPSLPVITTYDKIRYKRTGYSLRDILEGRQKNIPLFKRIFEEYLDELDKIKDVTETQINALTKRINKSVKEYLNKPSQEQATALIKDMINHNDLLYAYGKIPKRTSAIPSLVCLQIGDADVDVEDGASQVILTKLFSIFSIRIQNHIDQNNFGIETDGLLIATDSYSFLKVGLESQGAVGSFSPETIKEQINTIEVKAQVRKRIAVQRLKIVDKYELCTYISEILFFNANFKQHVAEKLNIAWPSKEDILIQVITEVSKNINKLTTEKKLNRSHDAAIIFNNPTPEFYFKDVFSTMVDNLAIDNSVSRLYKRCFYSPEEQSAKTLKLIDYIPTTKDFSGFTLLTVNQITAIKMIISNHKDISRVDFGPFRPPADNPLIQELMIEFEQIGLYTFSNDYYPKMPSLKGIFVYRDFYEKGNETNIIRSRLPILNKEAVTPIHSSSSSLLNKSKQAAVKTVSHLTLSLTSSASSSSSSSSSTAKLPIAHSVTLHNTEIDSLVNSTHYKTLTDSHLNPAEVFSKLTCEFSEFNTFLMDLSNKIQVSDTFRAKMVYLCLSKSTDYDMAYHWLARISDANPYLYMHTNVEFFIKINENQSRKSLYDDRFNEFSTKSILFFMELLPEHYKTLINAIIVNSITDPIKNNMLQLFSAYLKAMNLLDNFNCYDTLHEHYAFIQGLLQIEAIRAEILLALSNEFLFGSLYSSETLWNLTRSAASNHANTWDTIEKLVVPINSTIVRTVITQFHSKRFNNESPVIIKSTDSAQTRATNKTLNQMLNALSFKIKMSILMNNGLSISETERDEIYTAFILGLTHYIADPYRDTFFSEELDKYIYYIKSKKILMSTEQAIAILTSIQQLGSSKTHNIEHAILELIDRMPSDIDQNNPDNSAFKEAATPLIEHAIKGKHINLLRKIEIRFTMTPEHIARAGTAISEYQQAEIENHLPPHSANICQFFLKQLSSFDARYKNQFTPSRNFIHQLKDETKRIDILMTMVERLTAPDANAHDIFRDTIRTLTPRVSTVFSQRDQHPDLQVARLVSELSASNIASETNQLTLFTDKLKELYNAIMRRCYMTYLRCEKDALLTYSIDQLKGLDKDYEKLIDLFNAIAVKPQQATDLNYWVALLNRFKNIDQTRMHYTVNHLRGHQSEYDFLLNNLTAPLLKHTSAETALELVQALTVRRSELKAFITEKERTANSQVQLKSGSTRFKFFN